MNELIRIGTWNLCLGLANKKDYVTSKLHDEKINICCLQECEIDPNQDEKTLTLPNYKIELEDNVYKKRTGIYIHNSVEYERQRHLEEPNNHIVIIDLKCKKEYRIINVYRSFSPNNNITPTERFKNQLKIIKNAMNANPNKKTIILGDFNLDYNRIYQSNDNFSTLYEHLLAVFDPLGLIQLVNFETWSRFVQQIKKSSILDHIYSKDPELIRDLQPIDTEIGDHKLVVFKLAGKITEPNITFKRDWRKYDKQTLINMLNRANFNMALDCVQETWNRFENELIVIIDQIAPNVEHVNETVIDTLKDKKLKTLINTKKRLLKNKKFQNNFNQHLKIKNLNKEIKIILRNEKTKNIRRGIIPGNSKSLWNAVKKAKDLNITSLPESLSLNSVNIPKRDQPDAFAEFFKQKVKVIIDNCKVDSNVYNGTKKLNADNENFMTPENVISAIKSLKVKNCEGFDRIPVRILIDGIEELTPILSHLFNLIYKQRKIPEQWRISKVIPLFKKGNPNKIENYRPISNLCSTSKIFEKLILLRLTQLENIHNISLTGKSQHGFKKNHSTATIGLVLQSVLANALDQNNYALMASLDLSAAFDVVNIELLKKRLDIVGIPSDVVSLIEVWLTDRLYYVSINGDNSCLTKSETGTIQGSILGPILYAIFVAPLFDLEKLSNYADDNYIIRWNSCIESLIIDMKKSLEAITKWLQDSGLKVNETKTEMCLFHRNDKRLITLNLNNIVIKSTPQIKVLGIIFDSKLQWTEQVANCIKKSTRNLHAIKIISKYFNNEELKTLLTSNFYTVLYYNSEIWHLPSLNPYLKGLLLSASSKALKICTPSYNLSMSYNDLHVINNRATPDNFCLYKHSLLLHSLFNKQQPPIDWIQINFNQNLNNRNLNFEIYSNSNYKVGKNNKVSSRLACINSKIPLDWLNKEINGYKILCKEKFLSC
jgi:hypothetical protein